MNQLAQAFNQPKHKKEQITPKRQVKFTALLDGEHSARFDKHSATVKQRIKGIGKGGKTPILKWFINKLEDDPALFNQMMEDLEEQYAQ